MTRSSHQAGTLIVAATCAVAVGAYVAYSMHNQENSGEKETKDDDTVCSDMSAKNTTKASPHHSVPKTPPSLPRTTHVLAKKTYSSDQPWNSPGKQGKNESMGMFMRERKEDSMERMPPSPIFSRSGDDVSDDDLSLDGALPPFNISSEHSFSGELSKNSTSSRKGAGLRLFLVLVLAAAGACYVYSMGATTTATPLSLPMINAWTSTKGETTQQGNKHRSLVTRGVTDVAAFHPLGVLSMLHGSTNGDDDSSVVGSKQTGDNDAWQRSLNGCYGPFVGF